MTLVRGWYETRHPWPDDTRQFSCGRSGMVIRRGTNETYMTAFFEASPAHPATFIRGEGETVEAAEDHAWAQFERITAPGHTHEFEARGYTNGAGFCKYCGLFQIAVFTGEQLGQYCRVCSTPTVYDHFEGAFYCEEHVIPLRAKHAFWCAQRADGKDVPVTLEEILARLLVEATKDQSTDDKETRS